MPRLNRYYKSLQLLKDQVMFELFDKHGLSLDDLGWIFKMTKQGIHKAIKRHKEIVDR